ncbi:hypothetical protein [Aliiroseovarius crassostreae]|uniref:hypothetical protein n=1 Tax=Aliiroseovarius crassostreae TaxID=154981 RepID=UPI003C7AD613
MVMNESPSRNRFDTENSLDWLGEIHSMDDEEARTALYRACLVKCGEISNLRVSHKDRSKSAVLVAFRIAITIRALESCDGYEKKVLHVARSALRISKAKMFSVIHDALVDGEQGNYVEGIRRIHLSSSGFRKRFMRQALLKGGTGKSIADIDFQSDDSELIYFRLYEQFTWADDVHPEPAHWSFWKDWLLGELNHDELEIEILRRVALIPDPDWEKGPEHIARKIEEIKAGWLSEQVPSAEKIEFDEDTQKFHVVPLEIAKPDLLGATLSQIEDALEDVLACPSNGLHDGSKAVRVLRRTLTKYGNNPQQIEMGLVTAHTAITRQFLSDEMPQSEENLALRDAIEEGARGIRATHPEVAENRKILQDQALREMSQEDLDLLEDAKPLLEAWSAEDLAEDWAHDIPQLINDAVTPLPSGAPPLPGAEEATRIFSRTAKMKLSYDAIVSKGASAFDSKTMKTVRLGLTLGGVLTALVSMGLRVFGLI